MKKLASLLLVTISLLLLVGCSKTNTITLELNGGVGENTVVAAAGDDITAPAITKDGYTLEGWYEDAAFATAYTFKTMPSKDITIYAKWDINSYTISFDLDEGSAANSITANYGTSISAPLFTKEGHSIEGWYTDSNLSSEFEFTTMPAADTMLYAKWVANDYTITLELNGGTGDTSIIAKAGTLISEPTVTKEGFTFSGWYTDIDYTSTFIFYIMEGKDITLYAKWDINEYSISLTATADEARPTKVKGDIVDNMQTYTISTPPALSGFIFSHWQVLGTTTSISDEASFVYAASADVSLEAVYSEIFVPVEPELSYETSFEDAQKQSYAQGLITLSDKSWDFNDALVGSLLTDLSVSGNSARIRDGFIETQFSTDELAQVVFHAGTYGNDADGLVTFEVSVDGTTWVVVDSFTSTGTLEEYNYVFDAAMFASLSLSADDSYYMKITSSADSRTNVDDFRIYTGEGELVDHTPLYTISFTEDMEYSYLIGETVDLTQCVATHETNGPTTCDIIGTVDSAIPGTYEITYYKIDEAGNTAAKTVKITIVNDDTTDYLSLDLVPYYDDAEGLFGSDLLDALHDIVNNGFDGVTYGEARYILDDSDRDPNNPNNVILVYTAASVSGTWNCSSGCTWNREHVWPQSLLGVSANNGAVNVASDLYNLMPANPGENSSRGNSPYSEMGFGYEPRDEVKGDVARALFYMMIMYDNLNLVDSSPSIHEMGYLSELLQWHLDDPVDEFELNRLEVIFSEQNNRNPFVDYPHFVELLWFND